jgi:hypothetical protein
MADTIELSSAGTDEATVLSRRGVPVSLILQTASIAEGVATGGQITSFNLYLPWVYTLTTVPTDFAIGTALHVPVNLTISNNNGFGPQSQTVHFGPRGIINLEGPIRYSVNHSGIAIAPVGYLDTLTITNTAGVARTLTYGQPFNVGRSVVADGATVTLLNFSEAPYCGAAYSDASILASVDGGTIDGTTNSAEHVGFSTHVGYVGNVSLARRVHYNVEPAFLGYSPLVPNPVGLPHWSGVGNFDATSAATVTVDEEVGFKVGALSTDIATTRIGLDITQFTGAGTKIGIRNAGTKVSTPSVATITAAGNTIAADAEVKRLDNTSGGSVTLTSTPTIADGVDGQFLTLFNSSANNVVLTHGAANNLRLDGGTNKTLAQRASIELMFSTTLGDWIQTRPVVSPT